MSAKRTVGRSELSFEVGDGLLDIDEILSRDSWYQIDDFVQRNFLQEILNEFNDLYTLDPERAPEEQKKKQRAVRPKRTPQKTEETFVETRVSNAKAGVGEKLEDKIEKPSTSKKKSDEKSGDSGKIEKKKQAASVCKKVAGKSAKDRKSQGNSPAASTSSTVAMSDEVTTTMPDDVTTTCDASTWVKPSVLSNVTETTEGRSEMSSQDALGYSFETSVPQGESSRIDMEKTVIETRSEAKSKEDNSGTFVDAEKTILINVEDKRKERKSLGRSRGEYSGGEVRLDVTPDKEISEEHGLEKTKRRRRQPTRKPKGVKHDVVGEIAEEDIASGSGEKRSGRKSSGRSKTSKEKANVGIVADEAILTSHEESKVEKSRGRKKLRVSKWVEEQSQLEEQILGDEELGGQSRAKRRSLDTSKSSQENVGKIAEKNISHEEPDGEKKRGRKSLRRSKCSEEQHSAEKQSSDVGESSGQTRPKRRSLETSKSSKQDAEKVAEKNLSSSRDATAVDEETGNWSLGVSQCSGEVAGGTIRRRSLRTSKSSKEDAERTSKQNISNEEPEGESTQRKSLPKSSKEVSPVGKRLPQDREQSVAEEIPKRRSLRVSRASRGDAEKSVEKNTSISQEEAGNKSSETSESRKEKKAGRKPGKKNTSTRRKSRESNAEKQEEKPRSAEQAKNPAGAEKESGWRSLGIPKSWIEKKIAEQAAAATTSTGHKEPDGEKQESKKEESKCTEQEKNPADVDNEIALKSVGTSKSGEEGKSDEQPEKKNTSIDHKKSDGKKQKEEPRDNEDSDLKKKAEARCSRETCPAKREKDRKTGGKKSKRNKSAKKDRKVSRYQKMLAEKKKKREERRLQRHERKANRAMAEFSNQVTSIAKKMGYLQENKSDSSDSSDFSGSSSPSESDETEDSSISSGSSVCSSSCSCCTYGTDCSCTDRSSCSGCGEECTDPNCHCAAPCSCIDFTDSSDEIYSDLTD